jgi:glyoxylase-like metal-dependent hydrolase (beta-lactamase superfamily II)
MPDADSAISPVRYGLQRQPIPALPGLHQIILPTPWEVGPVQIYLVLGDPITLIDTGVRTAQSRAALGAALDQLGLAVEDVRRVVVTHYHGDHLGQAQWLREAGAEIEVWAHADEAPWIEHWPAGSDEEIEQTNALFREHGVPADLLERQTAQRLRWRSEEPALCESTRVDRVVRDGDEIPFKDFAMRVIHAPGHTAGHILLHEEESGAVLTGDHLMGDAVPFTETFYLDGAPDPRDPLARRPRFRGLLAYLRSVRGLRVRGFRTILPAHGGILDHPQRAIEEAILFYDVRVQRVERALAKHGAAGATAWEIWQALFPKADPLTQMRTRMTMVIGALDVLEDADRAVARRRGDGTLLHASV